MASRALYVRASAVARVASVPCSSWLAAFQSSQRIEFSSICISASMKAMTCFWAIGWPKATRSFA